MSPTTTRANLGPLTTTFTPPARCTEAMLAPAAPARGWRAQTCRDGHMVDDAACWPSPAGDVAAPPPDGPLWGRGVYTPGLACPGSYAAACSATAGAGGGFAFQFGLEAGETAVGCCPSGYGCHRTTSSNMFISTVVQTCTSYATRGSFVAATCTGNGSVVGTQTISSLGAASSTGFFLQAPLIQLAWRSSDLAPESTSSARRTTSTSHPASSSSSSATAPSSTHTLAAASSTAAPSNAVSSASPVPDTPSSLSLGAAVGIGVGAALLVLAITAAAMCLVSRRRRRRRDEDAPSEASAPDPRLAFKAYRYGPGVEVPGSYGTGGALDALPETSSSGQEEASAREQAHGQVEPQTEQREEHEPKSLAVRDEPRPREEVDHLWDRLYEEVRGGWASEHEENLPGSDRWI